MAGFFAPKKLENHTSEGSMRKGDKEKARRKKGISTLAEKKKKKKLFDGRALFGQIYIYVIVC